MALVCYSCTVSLSLLVDWLVFLLGLFSVCSKARVLAATDLHMLTPCAVPYNAGDAHTVTVELNGDAATFSVHDLRSKFQQHAVTATMQCSGNRASEMIASQGAAHLALARVLIFNKLFCVCMQAALHSQTRLSK
jgi:hypothetical protein